jgi:hypothetical protein
MQIIASLVDSEFITTQSQLVYLTISGKYICIQKSASYIEVEPLFLAAMFALNFEMVAP